MQISCSNCQRSFNVTAKMSGKKAKCPCGTLMRLPEFAPPQQAVLSPPEEEIVTAELVHPQITEQYTESRPSSFQQPYNSPVAPASPNTATYDELQTKTSRTYSHVTCGSDTTVYDDSHVYVAQVFAHPKTTYCGGCEDYFPMGEFCWSNTQERLTDYYARYQSKYSNFEKMVCGPFVLLAPLLGFVIGGLFGLLIFSLLAGIVVGLILGTIGAFTCAVIAWFVQTAIMQSIDKRLLGTHDHTQLK